MEYCSVASAELLSADEEVELAERIEAGLYAARLAEQGGHPLATGEQLDRLIVDGESALERFLMANIRLVSMVSRPIARSTGMSEPDLFQEGFAGLVQALHRFDHRRGSRFASYALPWIRAGVGEAASERAFGFRMPPDRGEIRRTWWRLAQSLRREPTLVEVARAAGVTTERAVRAMRADGGVQLFDDTTWFEPVDPDAQHRLAAVVEHPVPVHEWLAALPRLEARVLWLRFGFSGRVVGYAEAARTLQLGASRVRRLEHRALERLREVCRTDDLPAAG